MTEEEIKNLIKESGNNFHYQVVDFLRKRDWEVLVSPYYSDNITNKTREIDIIAEKPFDVLDWAGDCVGTLNIKFFIECKYINKEIVFWFDSKNKEKAIERVINDTSLEHPRKNSIINSHHYLDSVEVAKLFHSNSNRNSSLDNEIIYKAISQSLNSMIYHENAGSIIPEQENKIPNIKRTIKYPLILCNNFNKFYKVNSKESKGYSKINNNFQLEVDYVYLDKDKNSKDKYFLIDVIDFDKLDLFLEELETKDIDIIRGHIAP